MGVTKIYMEYKFIELLLFFIKGIFCLLRIHYNKVLLCTIIQYNIIKINGSNLMI